MCVDTVIMNSLTNHEIFDSSSGRPYTAAEFDDYHTAPLLLSGAEAKEELIENQDRLLRQFGEISLYEISRYAQPEVAEYGAERIGVRIHQVEAMNANIYNYERLNQTPDLTFGVPTISPETVANACEAALRGKGSVLQNKLARRAFGMPSIGLAELTIIGEFRRELEPPMWDEVSELTGSDATPRFEQMTNLRVLGFHQYDDRSNAPQNFDALRIGMKRNLGTLDDGTEVKSRSIALINTDPRYGVQRDDVAEILQDVVKFDEGRKRFEHVQNADMSRNAAFVRVLRWLVEERMKPGTVLARNESVYGYNPGTQALIEARRQNDQLSTY